jgi:hypothetical protein
MEIENNSEDTVENVNEEEIKETKKKVTEFHKLAKQSKPHVFEHFNPRY